MSLIEPNMHPVLVHFTFSLMSVAAICSLVVALSPSATWRESLGHAVDWMIAFGAVAVVLTVAAGFEAYYTVAHDGPSHEAMTTHRNWAVPTAVALLSLAGWRWLKRRERPSLLFASLFVAAALSLSVTGWWGGRLVYEYGLGVSSLPQVTGKGHDHDHGGDHGRNHDVDDGQRDGHDNHDHASEEEQENQNSALDTNEQTSPPASGLSQDDDEHDHGDHAH